MSFGAKFLDIIKSFIVDMQWLQDSIQITLHNKEKIFIKDSLKVVTTDLPQGNDLCEVK